MKTTIFKGISLVMTFLLFYSCNKDETSGDNIGADSSSDFEILSADIDLVGKDEVKAVYSDPSLDSLYQLSEPGEDQVWDFSNLPASPDHYDTLPWLDPASLALSDTFPQADLASYDGSSFSVFKLTSDKMEVVGHYDSVNQRETIMDDPLTILTFPVRQGGSFRDEGKVELEPGYYMTQIRDVVYDASGELILPSGSYDCVRAKIMDITTYDTSYAYDYISKSLGMPVMTIDVNKNDSIERVKYLN
ncbi:MAG: hypothetical protein ACOCVN_02520 [bacterium]